MATNPPALPDNQGDTNIKFVGDQALTTISYRQRQLVMYPVQEHEFGILASGYTSLHFGLAGVFFGADVTLGATIATVSLSAGAARVFTDALIFSIAATVYCIGMAIKDYRNAKKTLKTIRAETVDVIVGELPK